MSTSTGALRSNYRPTAIRAAITSSQRSARTRGQIRTFAILGSAAVGLLLTVSIKYGLALMIALCYVPLAMTDLGAGLIVWIALPFLAGIGALNLAGKAAAMLVAAAWFGVLAQRRLDVWGVVRRNRVAFTGVVALSLWVTLSVLWATSPSTATGDLWHWYADALIFLIVATTIRTRRLAQFAAAAFVIGGVLSVLYGMAGGVSGAQAANVASYGGRLGGATGDPNFLAAGVVAAVVLAAALLLSRYEVPTRMRPLVSAAVGLILIILIAGIVATQSRGGLVACLVVIVVAIPAFPRQRRWVMTIVLMLAAIMAVAFALSPSALQRVTQAGNGSGRTDEWTIALRVVKAHPLTGVGDANYTVVERNYTRLPGTLTEAQYLVDRPEVAHNTYLQLLSEIGIIGFGLFVLVALACVRAAWLAARRFRALGDVAMEVLSRGLVVSQIGMLTASAFISAEVDQRLWALLAFGPAFLAVAWKQRRAPTDRTHAERFNAPVQQPQTERMLAR
jgi:O-antigen ligase